MKKYSGILIILFVTGTLSMGLKYTGGQHQPETMELIPMMRLLLSDMYTINEGIYTEDYDLIEEGGSSIADHPAMTEEDKALIKKTLGEEFKQFVKYDMTVHHNADSIAIAATSKDMQEILKRYRIVQQGCVDCHTNYRAQIIKAKEGQ